MYQHTLKYTKNNNFEYQIFETETHKCCFSINKNGRMDIYLNVPLTQKIKILLI